MRFLKFCLALFALAIIGFGCASGYGGGPGGSHAPEEVIRPNTDGMTPPPLP